MTLPTFRAQLDISFRLIAPKETAWAQDGPKFGPRNEADLVGTIL